MSETTTGGSAAAQASLWSERSGDWAQVMEGDAAPWLEALYEEVCERFVRAGTEVLDVGCGAGRFARMAADRGATVCGLDATPQLLEIAAARTPEADFRHGDMESLPWPDGSFDLVTGFQSFFFAADVPAALREARRVARPGAALALTAFGRPQPGPSVELYELIGEALPAISTDDDGPGVQGTGVLEAMVAEAGFADVRSEYRMLTLFRGSLEDALRGLLAAGPLRQVARAVGDEKLRQLAMQAFHSSEDGHRAQDEFRLITATA